MLHKYWNGIKIFTSTAMLSTTILVAGCGGDSSSSSSEGSYSAGAIPSKASKVDVISYDMPYVSGETASTTAMVLYPKTTRPADGWRMVVWTHGTTGVGDACAPSQNPLGKNFSILANSLLAQGYVVVAPDYEGLGTSGIHPYLNLESEAQSAIYAVKAMKAKYSNILQGDWMSIGQSQGGHASLGVAQFANTDTTYKGAVATAPASSLGYIISEIAPAAIANLEANGMTDRAVDVYAELLSYAAYTAVGIKAYKPEFDYSVLFEPRSYKIAVNAEGTTGDNGLCLDGMIEKYSADIQAFLAEDASNTVMDYPALKSDFTENETIAAFLQSSQPGTKKLDKPVLVVQGTLDMAVPYQVTESLVDGLNQLGTTPEVELDLVSGASHTEAIVWRNASIVSFIESILPSGE